MIMMRVMSDRQTTPTTGRLASLDVFRGITIAGMLLVNNPGDWGHVFAPLRHAKWDGCTATDFVFPFFLFIMGVAMPFSFSKHFERGATPGGMIASILRRTVVLFALGLFLNSLGFMAFSEYFRPMGVLQRIALCYLAAGLIIMWTGPRGQAIWCVVMLAGYWALMTFVHPPIIGESTAHPEWNNLASWLDTRLLGPHNYQFDKNLGVGHDPEGLLSTLPAVVTALSGCLAGAWLRSRGRGDYEKAAGLFVPGYFLVVTALWWDYSCPMNKNLWTSSYVLFTSGWALLSLGVCYWVIDIKRVAAWAAPFTVFGTNAIAAYVCASAAAYATVIIKFTGPEGKPVALKTWLYTTLFKSWLAPLCGDYVSSAAYGLSYVAVWCAIMWLLHRKRIFIKV